MATAANTQSYPNTPWQNPSGGGNAPWSGAAFWHPQGLSRPAGIAAMILGFALWWPVGLAILAFMVASGRMGCGRRRWSQQGQSQPGQNGDSWHSSGCSWSAPWSNRAESKPASTGNHAFDEYRAETLRRMEEEQSEFSGFLERLRMAKDKAEFDQFMAERRQTPRPPTVPDQPSQG